MSVVARFEQLLAVRRCVEQHRHHAGAASPARKQVERRTAIEVGAGAEGRGCENVCGARSASEASCEQERRASEDVFLGERVRA